MRRIPRLAALAVLAGAATVGAGLMAACTSPTSHPRAPAPARSAVPAPPPAAHDWRTLMTVPFGTLLKDVPYRLDEVVVFHGPAGGGGQEDRDCYTPRGTAPPRLFGRTLDEYSLCFSGDRLHRIEASVQLAADSASAQFAAACAEWQRRGIPGIAAADRCELRDGSTQVEARLTASEISGGPAVFIVLVDSTPPRDPVP